MAGLAAAISLAGCNQGGGNAPTTPGPEISTGARSKVGLIVTSKANPKTAAIVESAEATAKKVNCDLTVIEAPDEASVKRAIDRLAGLRVRGVIWQPYNPTYGDAARELFEQKKLKFMTIDLRAMTQIPDSNPPMYKIIDNPHAGIDDRDIGNTLGNSLIEAATKAGWTIPQTRIIVLSANANPRDILRARGAIESFEASEYPLASFIQVVVSGVPSKETVQAATSSKVSVGAGLKYLVISVTDSSSIGVVDALKAKGVPTSDIIAIGVNELGKFDALNTEGVKGTIFVNYREIGRSAVETMHQWVIRNEEPDSRPFFVEPKLVTKENMAEVTAPPKS